LKIYCVNFTQDIEIMNEEVLTNKENKLSTSFRVFPWKISKKRKGIECLSTATLGHSRKKHASKGGSLLRCNQVVDTKNNENFNPARSHMFGRPKGHSNQSAQWSHLKIDKRMKVKHVNEES